MEVLFYAVVGSLFYEGTYRKARIDQVATRVVGLYAHIAYRMGDGQPQHLTVSVSGTKVIIADGKKTWDITDARVLQGLDYQFWCAARFR